MLAMYLISLATAALVGLAHATTDVERPASTPETESTSTSTSTITKTVRVTVTAKKTTKSSGTLSFVTSTTQAPKHSTTIINDSGCKPNCSVVEDAFRMYNGPTVLTWSELSVTSTFTAATVMTIINTVRNTTRTSTVLNPVPSGVTAPPHNDLGTQTYVFEDDPTYSCTTKTSIREDKVTDVSTECSESYGYSYTVTYPTPFTWWPFSQYTWSGTLPTTQSGHPGSTICSTAPPSYATVEFSTMPQGVLTDFPAGMRTDDPLGYRFSMVMAWEKASRPPQPWWPNEGALSLCSFGWGWDSPFGAAMTIAWTTATATSFEGEEATQGPEPTIGPPPRSTSPPQVPVSSSSAPKSPVSAVKTFMSVLPVSGGDSPPGDHGEHKTPNDDEGDTTSRVGKDGVFLSLTQDASVDPALVSAQHPNSNSPAPVETDAAIAEGKGGLVQGNGGSVPTLVGTRTSTVEGIGGPGEDGVIRSGSTIDLGSGAVTGRNKADATGGVDSGGRGGGQSGERETDGKQVPTNTVSSVGVGWMVNMKLVWCVAVVVTVLSFV